MKGERILIVSHGNTLRGLVMRLEGLTPDEVKKLELRTAATRVYSLGADGKVAKREVYDVNAVKEGGIECSEDLELQA
jgi:2,3-bisphosphoglycerate-dependent phosphoglycerate mutase